MAVATQPAAKDPAVLFRRFDGQPSRGIPAYRRIIPFIMRGRNESAVFFEQTIDLSRTLPWIEEHNRGGGNRVTLFHLVLFAAARVLHERPRLNRFVAGRKLHDRDGVWISFAAKKQMSDDAPLATVKRRFPADESFSAMAAAMASDVAEARSERSSSVDRELGVLLRMPTLVLDGAVRLLRTLDFFDLAPRALLEHDPMYTSLFVANLGSLKIDAAYHHLYEYGNCPLFATVGKIEQAPIATSAGELEVRTVVKLKFTYDERIEDGLYCARALEIFKQWLEDPASWVV